MKKPMTTEELFNKIKDILGEKNLLPDILDYGIATSNPVPIRTYMFDWRSNLASWGGGNEGIYLDLWMEYSANGERRINNFGTFKTLDVGDEAMHTMASAL